MPGDSFPGGFYPGYEIPGVGEEPTGPPVITNPGPQESPVGLELSLLLAATNSPTSWSATGLPKGLTINAGGLIAGTPTTVEATTVEVKATNSFGTGTATFTWAVEAVVGTPIGGMLIRERPPLRLNIGVTTPAGVTARWGSDDPNPSLAPKDTAWGTAMPGGFTTASATLERDARRFYADSEPFSLLTIRGVGGSTVFQGRIEKTPDTGGYQAQETIEAVGLQSALTDDETLREIYVDQQKSSFGTYPLARKLALLAAGFSLDEPTVGAPEADLGASAIITALNGAWVIPEKTGKVCTATYDGRGIAIGSIDWAWVSGPNAAATPHFIWYVIASDEEGLEELVHGTFGETFPGPLTGTLNVAQDGLSYAQLQLVYDIPGGEDGKIYPLYWTAVGVYGRHGLPKYGALTANEARGLLASDVVAHALGKWAPQIGFSVGPEGTITPSTYVIGQLAFIEPTTVAEVIKQATRFELLDWAVWEGPTLYMNERGARGKQWRTRVGPGQLQEAGPQVSRLWNGVAVQYTDATGVTRVVGPPGLAGSTAAMIDASLLDTDPENPANQKGERKWALLKMGTGTPAGAKELGRRFLEEQKRLELSGQAAIVGHVEDMSGNYWPAYLIRAGDEISFTDAAITAPRRIVNTNYSDATKTNTLQLDQPPDGMQALLERLSVVLVPLGIG